MDKLLKAHTSRGGNRTEAAPGAIMAAEAVLRRDMSFQVGGACSSGSAAPVRLAPFA